MGGGEEKGISASVQVNASIITIIIIVVIPPSLSCCCQFPPVFTSFYHVQPVRCPASDAAHKRCTSASLERKHALSDCVQLCIFCFFLRLSLLSPPQLPLPLLGDVLIGNCFTHPTQVGCVDPHTRTHSQKNTTAHADLKKKRK
jgi:hypothetical protein